MLDDDDDDVTVAKDCVYIGDDDDDDVIIPDNPVERNLNAGLEYLRKVKSKLLQEQNSERSKAGTSKNETIENYMEIIMVMLCCCVMLWYVMLFYSINSSNTHDIVINCIKTEV